MAEFAAPSDPLRRLSKEGKEKKYVKNDHDAEKGISPDV